MTARNPSRSFTQMSRDPPLLGMRIVIVTDAWSPQTNGVVSTLRHTISCLESFGHEVFVVSPRMFRSMPCPTYPEIRLSLFPSRKLSSYISEFKPEALHIATEGPLGNGGPALLREPGHEFHARRITRNSRSTWLRVFRYRRWLSYRALRWFHGAATHCMVSTQTVRNQLAEQGFRNLARWQRGVNTELFRPRPQRFPGSSATCRRLRRAGGDRKEHRCIPVDALGRNQAGDRRRAGAATIEGSIP